MIDDTLFTLVYRMARRVFQNSTLEYAWKGIYAEIVPQSPYMRRSIFAAFISAYAVITFAYAHVDMSAYTAIMCAYAHV